MLPQIATFYFLVLLASGVSTVFADDDSPVVDEGSETQLFTAVLVVFKF